MPSLDQEYWESRYKNGQTQWDIGYAAPALVDYVRQEYASQKEAHILIPGAGNGHEAGALHQEGFRNVSLLDIAEDPLQDFAKRYTEFPANQILHQDFFEHEGQYDLILEQTFFCAIDPSLRPAYARKMRELLAPGAVLAGLLFDFPLTTEGPPFGGDKSEYISYFRDDFKILGMERARNSISPRQGKELFFTVQKI